MRGTTRSSVLLIMPALLVSVLLSGCSAIPGWSKETPGSADAESSGDSWIVVAEGSATPSVPAGAGVSPSASPSSGFLPLPSSPPRPTPSPACTDASWRVGIVNGLRVVPGPSTATAHWVHPADANLVSYRLTAISQDLMTGKQRDVGWETIKPTQPCAPMSATIKGLARATPYTFSLDAVFNRKNADGTHAWTVARALVVYTS